MAVLYWAVQWGWRVNTLDAQAEAALIQVLRDHFQGKTLRSQDVGRKFEGLRAQVGDASTIITATLERIDPARSTVTVGPETEVYIHLVPGFALFDDHEAVEPAPGRELDDSVMWQTMFSPLSPDENHAALYQSLVGIDKEEVLAEMVSLLTPSEVKERWSHQHYGRSLPVLRSLAKKAPVIVLGGDPGTGKTALATSIGAPLAVRLRKPVHFRHMSLLIRGMGYVGRASSMIVKTFDEIRNQYTHMREPMILFFDEAEAIVGSRQQADFSSGAWENSAIVDAIIVGVDSLRKGMQAEIVALFATNLPAHIDTALMRRCYYHYFPRPNDEVRRQLIASALMGSGLTEVEVDILIDATKPKRINDTEIPFTHSDIVELMIGRAVDAAIRFDRPLTLDLLLEHCAKSTPTPLLSH